MPDITKPGSGTPVDRSDEVKFGVCAVLDLQGFSSHLETSGYDLRTAIGDQAVMRLRNLEEALQIIRDEQRREPTYYPAEIRFYRINDSLIIAMDLADVLLPSVGQTSFSGPTPERLTRFAESLGREFDDSIGEEYEAALSVAIDPLLEFLGLVSRLHLFIQKCEIAGLYPGAKTIVSAGYRKPFKTGGGEDDRLSANFAMSNAFAASKDLRGPNLYVDNSVVELISRNAAGRSLARFAHYHWNEAPFDALAESGGRLLARTNAEVPSPADVVLFRRRYSYRRLNPAPLSFLQAVPNVHEFLRGNRPPDLSSVFYGHVFNAIKRGISPRRVEAHDPPLSFVYSGTNDLSVDVADFARFLTNGHEAAARARHHRKRLKELGIVSPDEAPDLWRKLEELDNETVTIDVERIEISDLLPTLWSFGEESLSGLLPLLAGDRSQLDFPSE